MPFDQTGTSRFHPRFLSLALAPSRKAKPYCVRLGFPAGSHSGRAFKNYSLSRDVARAAFPLFPPNSSPQSTRNPLNLPHPRKSPRFPARCGGSLFFRAALPSGKAYRGRPRIACGRRAPAALLFPRNDRCGWAAREKSRSPPSAGRFFGVARRRVPRFGQTGGLPGTLPSSLPRKKRGRKRPPRRLSPPRTNLCKCRVRVTKARTHPKKLPPTDTHKKNNGKRKPTPKPSHTLRALQPFPSQIHQACQPGRL